jgi:hypothetical protein
MTKPSRALSLVAFSEMLERISEDYPNMFLRMQVQVAAVAGIVCGSIAAGRMGRGWLE